jgi:hypothetical protein
MYVPEGRISDRSLSCRCLAGNPVTPGSVRRTRRPTIKEDERGKKREAWNRKENKEGDNVDKIKTKQTNKTHKVKSTGFSHHYCSCQFAKKKIVTRIISSIHHSAKFRMQMITYVTDAFAETKSRIPLKSD